MFKKIKRYSLIISLFALGCLAGACAPRITAKKKASDRQEAPRDTKDEFRILTIGTADSGGTMYPVGSAIARAIGERDENIKVNISASNGSLTNVLALENGQIDLGLVSGDVAFCAYNGTEEFAKQRAGGLRAVAAVYSSISNWMAPEALGITYVHELEGKRITVGPKDSTTDLSARVALKAIGLNDKNTFFQNYGLGSGGEEVKDGSSDALHGFAGIPIKGLTELAGSLPCRLLQYTDEELREILSQNLYYYQTSIPSGTYPGQNSDVKTFGVKCLLCVDETMDEELVYRLTKILDEARPELMAGHEAMSVIEQNGFMCQDLPIPLHPGAKRYYEEAEYLKK